MPYSQWARACRRASDKRPAFQPVQPAPPGKKPTKGTGPAAKEPLSKQRAHSLQVVRIEADGNVHLTQRPVSGASATAKRERDDAEPENADEPKPKELWLVVTKALKLFPRESRMLCESPGFLQIQKLDEPEGVWMKINWESRMNFDADKGNISRRL